MRLIYWSDSSRIKNWMVSNRVMSLNVHPYTHCYCLYLIMDINIIQKKHEILNIICVHTIECVTKYFFHVIY